VGCLPGASRQFQINPLIDVSSYPAERAGFLKLIGGRPITIAWPAAIAAFWILIVLTSLGAFWGWLFG
jgi:hypothetical protein